MRNKLILGFVLLALALVGIGCACKEEGMKKIYEIYYLDRDENHIISLPYETETPKIEKEFLVKELLIQLGTQREEIEYNQVAKILVTKNKRILLKFLITK